jgi:YD repeat-containing protein
MVRHVCAPLNTMFADSMQMEFFKMAQLKSKRNFRLGVLLSFIFSFHSHCVMAGNSSTQLKKSDFYVIINHHGLTLGDDWSSEIQKQVGAQISENFVGDVPVGDTSYKYYQHKYDGFEIYTANLFWQKKQRDIDSYLIAQITINTPAIKTARGVEIGDSEDVLVSKYGQGTVDESNNQHWLYYDADSKRISFQLENKKISHIMMSINTEY